DRPPLPPCRTATMARPPASPRLLRAGSLRRNSPPREAPRRSRSRPRRPGRHGPLADRPHRSARHPAPAGNLLGEYRTPAFRSRPFAKTRRTDPPTPVPPPRTRLTLHDRLVLALLCTVAIGLIAFACLLPDPPPRDPIIRGYTMSHWLKYALFADSAAL